VVELLTDEHDAAAFRQFLEGVDHAAFEVETDGEDDVGGGEQTEVAGGSLIEVRVDTLAHETGDFDAVAADDADGVGEHADGGDSAELGSFSGGLTDGED
jgi:hypothetical protein